MKISGRIAISDIALLRELTEYVRNDTNANTVCIGGAIHVEQYETLIREAGFSGLKVVTQDISICLDYSTDLVPDTND